MAQKVCTLLVDDLDGTDAEETVTFSIDGRFYEIDLSNENAKRLRDALEPYRRNGRRAGTANLQSKGAVRGSYRPAHVQFDDSAQVREWAKRYDLPTPGRGRVNSSLRAAYRAFRNKDRGPLRDLLKENNLDPAAADTDGKTIFTKTEAPKATPRAMTADERNRLAARKATGISDAQITRLRKANADEDGQYISDGRDATSCQALVNRGLFVLIEERVYEITAAGRCWFEAHGVSPDL